MGVLIPDFSRVIQRCEEHQTNWTIHHQSAHRNTWQAISLSATIKWLKWDKASPWVSCRMLPIVKVLTQLFNRCLYKWWKSPQQLEECCSSPHPQVGWHSWHQDNWPSTSYQWPTVSYQWPTASYQWPTRCCSLILCSKCCGHWTNISHENRSVSGQDSSPSTTSTLAANSRRNMSIRALSALLSLTFGFIEFTPLFESEHWRTKELTLPTSPSCLTLTMALNIINSEAPQEQQEKEEEQGKVTSHQTSSQPTSKTPTINRTIYEEKGINIDGEHMSDLTSLMTSS